MRIAFARIAQETNSLSPVLTEVADFERTHLVDGTDLGPRILSRVTKEAPGMLRNAELSGAAQCAHRMGAEVVPIYSAWAIPGGPLSTAAFQTLRERFIERLRAAGPLDGLVLSLHGAMAAEGGIDADAVLLQDARDALPNAKIAATLDLHAHVNRAKWGIVDFLVGYRTNPHRDHAACGARAAKLVVQAIRGEIKPTSAWRSLPMVIGGGTTIDFLKPMRAVYKMLNDFERQPGVLGAWAYQCQIWNDFPDGGWAAVVTTDNDQALAERLADQLAEALWARRNPIPPSFGGPKEAVEMARAARWARRTGVVCISDASDMVGAGAVGESTDLLRALLDYAQDMSSYAPVRDAAAIEQIWPMALGEQVLLDVGGRLAPKWHHPTGVQGILRQKRETPFGRAAHLDLGHVQLIITERAPLAMKPAFYTDFGLRILEADIIVVKSLFPFRLYFLAYNRKTIYTTTRGTTDFDVWRDISYDRPVHPKDELVDWRAHVRRNGDTP